MIFMSTQISRVLLTEIKIKKEKEKRREAKWRSHVGIKITPPICFTFWWRENGYVENKFSRYVQTAVLDKLTSHAWRNVGHERRELSCNNWLLNWMGMITIRSRPFYKTLLFFIYLQIQMFAFMGFLLYVVIYLNKYT